MTRRNYEGLSNNITRSVNESRSSVKRVGYFDFRKLKEDTGIEKISMIPDAKYMVDFIPFPVTPDYPQYRILQEEQGSEFEPLEWIITIPLHKVYNGQFDSRFICPHFFGKKCPFCDEFFEYFERGKKKGINPKDTYAQNKKDMQKLKTVDRDLVLVQNNNSGKIEMIDYAHNFFGEIIKKRIERYDGDEERIIIADPSEKGRTMKFFVDASDMKDQKGDPLPSNISDIDFVRRNEIPYELIESAPYLNKYLIQYSEEDIYAMYDGTYFLPTDEDVKEEKPVERRREEPAEEPQQTEMDEREARRAARRSERSNTPTCPVPGYVFGEDTDVIDECTKCELYDACDKKYREQKADIDF